MLDRCEKGYQYHQRGFNCCQSVVAAFADKTGLSEQESFNVSSGFGGGAGTGELCGAITGAIMTLSLMNPVDVEAPLESKARVVKLSKEFQKRFSEKFGALRCQELLKNKFIPDDTTPAAKELGVTNHCSIMIVTAIEIVEEMLREMGR